MGRLAELQRKTLEQLMGPEAMGIIQVDISMWDPKVCKAFIAGICPHDLFTNTKMDLGACNRTHSNKVKAEYTSSMAKAEEDKDDQKIAELNRLKFEYEQVIAAFVEECDRRIRAAQRRLEKTPEENNRTTALMREIGEIEGAYQAAMADVEQLGSEGKVDESMNQLAKAEALKAEKQDKERELQNLTDTSGASGHQKLRVCDICGAYLSILDSDKRLADHFGGKMHLGYFQVRTLMDEWKARGPLPTATRAPQIMAPPPSVVPKQMMNEPAPPVAFRPIPAAMLAPRGGAFVPAGNGGSNGDSRRDSGRDGRDGGRDGGSRDSRGGSGRDSGRDSGSSSRDHKSSSSSRNYDERDRDSSSRSSRPREGESSSSSRTSSSRYDDSSRGEHRSSSRREEGSSSSSSRREDGSRRESSSRHEDDKSRSSRSRHEEGEERGEKEKRRRVE